MDPLGLKAGDSYPTADMAAHMALNEIYKRSRKEGLEYGGRVYKKEADGTYSYTKANRGTPVRVAIDYMEECPSNIQPMGYYHTHPYVPGYNSEEFSPKDIEMVNRLSYPGYLKTPTGRQLKYSPVQKTTSKR